jgi:uncharacterized ion transporter superfamily protein YfcC
MGVEELRNLSNEELKEKAKELKSGSTLSAFIIGFMVGVVIYGVASNAWGFFALIPLYFIYRMVKSDKKNEPLRTVLKERGLS